MRLAEHIGPARPECGISDPARRRPARPREQPTRAASQALLGLSFIAAVTTTIGLATGVLLLPEHNPVVSAKQAATLDVLSGGRLTLGVGIGWSAEEFAALGIPFAGRGRRTAEYVAAMRTLWADDVASFSGEFTRFESVRVNPKPVRRAPGARGMPGAGLGLAIVGSVAQANKGTVEVRTGPGGSTFTLAFPPLPNAGEFSTDQQE
jgi:alkanesulfonate monooxygenase SsuD/methylene tetrahydromethanopterin reductase-like flavin-dependent oxidoreductase (luciferase family)